MTVEETVKGVIAEELGITPDKIWRYEAIKKLGADSLTLVKITIELEDLYHIEYPRDLSSFLTVEDVIRYIEENSK